jgi:XTP/dITP diphosphohydrolase
MVRRGETAGCILSEPRGAGGFGYDPYFESSELGRTFAEASIAEKERISHRGRALRALLEAM